MVNNRNIRTWLEICSKLTIKTGDSDFIINFEHISHLVIVFYNVNFEQVKAGWACSKLTGKCMFKVRMKSAD